MFTGLVETKGTLATRRPAGPGAVLAIECPSLGTLDLGESVSVDGCCLTVKKAAPGGFEADASAETLARTTLGTLRVGSPVNLERSVPLGGRMGGHLVTGHVDGVCSLASRAPLGDSTSMTFTFPRPLARFIAEKGSVAVNGVSLTVNAAGAETFDAVIIPHTAEVTTLGELVAGGRANLEVDVLARYVARLLEVEKEQAGAEGERGDERLLAALRRAGYV